MCFLLFSPEICAVKWKMVPLRTHFWPPTHPRGYYCASTFVMFDFIRKSNASGRVVVASVTTEKCSVSKRKRQKAHLTHLRKDPGGKKRVQSWSSTFPSHKTRRDRKKSRRPYKRPSQSVSSSSPKPLPTAASTTTPAGFGLGWSPGKYAKKRYRFSNHFQRRVIPSRHALMVKWEGEKICFSVGRYDPLGGVGNRWKLR